MFTFLTFMKTLLSHVTVQLSKRKLISIKVPHNELLYLRFHRTNVCGLLNFLTRQVFRNSDLKNYNLQGTFILFSDCY